MELLELHLVGITTERDSLSKPRLTLLGLSVVTCPVACQLVDDCCEATVLSLLPVSFGSRTRAVTDDIKYITYHVWAREGTLRGRTQSEESGILRAKCGNPLNAQVRFTGEASICYAGSRIT